MSTRRTVLATQRLVVTTWLPEDLADLAALHADPLTMQWVRSGRPETLDETRDVLERYRRQQDDPGWTKWRVATHDGEFVGRAGFGGHELGRELGYTVRPTLWGQGLASEAALALVGWHREHAPDSVLRALAALENAASRRVLEKAGFVQDGVEEHGTMTCASYVLP